MNTQELPDFGWSESTETAATMRLAPIIDAALIAFAEDQPLRIIDLGCGNGRMISMLGKSGRHWTGIDPSPTGVQLARKAAPDARISQLALSESLLDELGEAPFDAAVSIEVVEHMYSIWDWGRFSFTSLRPGGLLLASTPYHGWLKNSLISLLGKWDRHHNVLRTGGHIKFLSRATLEHLLKEVGFVDIEFRFTGRMPLLWKNMLISARKPL
jgi:2-polyprenyl-3-methyl-5-hydroxy-6-metoxy-1,4-benzoquinol methylase